MTTARKLWLGFGTLTALLAAVCVAVLLRVRSIEAAVEEQANVARVRSDTARELEVHVVGFALAVRLAVYADDPKARPEAADAAAGVERHLAEYRRLARTDRQRELADRFDERWRACHALGQALLDPANRPARRQDSDTLADRRRGLERLLAEEVQAEAVGSYEAHRDATLRDARAVVGFVLLLLLAGVGVAVLTGGAVGRAVVRDERVIEERGERLRTTLASIGDGVLAADTAGRITGLNPVAEALTGWTTAEATGRPMADVFRIVNEETRRPVENPAARALAEGVVVGLANHTVLIAKDGTERPIDDSAAPIRCKDGEVVGCVLVFRDITDRRRLEREAADRLAAARLLAAVVEWSDDAIVSKGLDGTIRTWNAAAERVFGFTAAEAVGRPVTLLIPDDRLGEEDHILTRLRAGERVEHFDTVRRRKDGTPVPVSLTISPVRDEAGNVVGASKVARDITDRKRAEERLRDAEGRFRQALTHVAVPAILHAEDDEILLVNQAWTDLTGYRVEDIPTLGDWTQRAFGERHATVKEYIDRLFDADARVDNGEWAVTTAAGDKRLWHFHTTPMGRGADGRRLLVSTAIDITDRKRTEDELRRVAAELSEADRRKNEFLATLAHELRNPLAPIRTGLQLMRLAKDDGRAVEQARTMMDRQLTQMVRLVDDLMDISRITRGKIDLRREWVDLAAVVQSAVETSRPLVEQMGHDLTVAVPDHPVVVDADPTRLAQVLANLLNNSAKYMDRGGHVWLTVERQGSDVVVAVRDAGIGIAADQLPRIFQMFMQVDRSLEKAQGGLGIGLTLVKRLVEMHGGTIEAKSDGPGKGSEFVVRLPVVVEASRPRPAGERFDPAPPKSALRILIVDDNRDGADSLAMMLKMMGNDTRTAYDGEEGVAAAGGFRPDVILLDIGLPLLNGYEACRRIRGESWGRGVVVIAQTGWGADEDRRRTHEAGFDHHMVKPVDPQALMKLLADLHVVKG